MPNTGRKITQRRQRGENAKKTNNSFVTRSKYGNKKINVQGMTFDSKREWERYIVLHNAEKTGIISKLERQVRYELVPPVTEQQTIKLKTKEKTVTKTLQKAITYVCDFRYIKDGQTIIEDVKIAPSMIPKEFLIKEKLLFWRYGIKIKRVYSPNDPI